MDAIKDAVCEAFEAPPCDIEILGLVESYQGNYLKFKRPIAVEPEEAVFVIEEELGDNEDLEDCAVEDAGTFF